ncbi:MAG: substrate-binding domain-containing protein [Alphaproteobacteria bacterium]
MKYFKHLTCALSLCAVGLAANAQDYKIGASLLTQQHPFYVDLTDAMKAEAEKQNVDLKVSIANQDLNKQLADIQDFITQDVDAIILSPVDSKGVGGALARAKKAGIPVFTVDISADGSDVVSHVATDNYGGGEIAGDLMGQFLGGKGEVAVIHYPTVQSVIDRVDGFSKVLNEKYPDIEIVDIQPGITRPEALSATQNMLQAHPDITGIFGFGDDAALAATVAVNTAKKQDQVKIIGFDGLEEARNAVDKEKAFVAVIRQYPDKMGATALNAAVDYLNGKEVEAYIPIVPGVYPEQ